MRKLLYPLFQKLWHWMYPVAARKALEEWNIMTDYELALTIIAANPESAEFIANFYLNKHKRKEKEPCVRCWSSGSPECI